MLKNVLWGTKRLPILLLNNPLHDLNRLGLANYEITLVEYMRDIANHIDKILVELPNHLKSEDKVKMIELLAVLNKEKETKCCYDKQKILLQVTKSLQYKIDGNVYKLLRTQCEIQRLLRLHNASFETALKTTLDTTLKTYMKN